MRPGQFKLLNDRSITAFGQLVRTWATNERSRPNNLTEFRTQLEKSDIQYELAEEIKTICLKERQRDTLSILLPLKERVESIQDQWIACDKSYSVPFEYTNIPINSDGSVKSISIDGFEELDNFRIGDYSSSQCA